MNTRSAASASHLDDVDLVRLIDEEGSRAERDAWEAHLQECRLCRDSADELRRQSELVGRWVAFADHESPMAPAPGMGVEPAAWRRAAQGPWLKAAVFVLILAAPLAAFPGVRDWVADRVAGAGPAVTAAPRALADVDGGPPARIRFVPEPGTFAVALDAVQAGGTLTAGRMMEGDEAVLEVAGPAPLPEPIISSRSIRIGNTTGSSASYTLRLPREVVSLTVTIAGVVTRLDAGDLDSGAILPLDGSWDRP
jgi:hypothetical protein